MEISFESKDLDDLDENETNDSDLDYIEVLDMDDELLNITIIFSIGKEENIEKIKEFLDLNGFVDKG